MLLTSLRLVSQCKRRLTVKVPRVTGELCPDDKDTRSKCLNLRRQIHYPAFTRCIQNLRLLGAMH